MKKILVTGGTGFIGTALCQQLLADGHELMVLSRQPVVSQPMHHARMAYINQLDSLPRETRIDACINLAGEPLDNQRWNPAFQQKLVDSRVNTTKKLVSLINRLDHKPDVFVSGSAIGWYGHQANTPLGESAQPVDGFAHRLCEAWEQAARECQQCRVICLRIGIVLEKDGGPLKAMLPAFRAGLGGRMGTGKQMWSWIHRHDLVRLICHLVENPDIKGAVNATSPHAVAQADFARQLANALHRPAVIPMPAFVARAALGGFADEILLHGQHVVPQAALQAGFTFDYATLEAAFSAIFEA